MLSERYATVQRCICVLCSTLNIDTSHCRQCILTSQMNSFIYKVSIVIFYTVELNTDFANIKTNWNICEVSIQFECIKYNNTDFVNE